MRAGGKHPPMGDRRDENDSDRLDRELIELLNELRVILPGVQVLFAFLLILPFQPRFGDVATLGKAVYLGSFLAATVASILLIAPTTFHRIRWRQRDKERLLAVSNRLALVATLFLAASIAAVVHVIVTLVYGEGAGALAAAGTAGLVAWLWYGLPLGRRRRDGGRPRRAC